MQGRKRVMTQEKTNRSAVRPEVGRTPSWGDPGLGHGAVYLWGCKMDKIWMTKTGEDI